MHWPGHRDFIELVNQNNSLTSSLSNVYHKNLTNDMLLDCQNVLLALESPSNCKFHELGLAVPIVRCWFPFYFFIFHSETISTV